MIGARHFSKIAYTESRPRCVLKSQPVAPDDSLRSRRKSTIVRGTWCVSAQVWEGCGHGLLHCLDCQPGILDCLDDRHRPVRQSAPPTPGRPKRCAHSKACWRHALSWAVRVRASCVALLLPQNPTDRGSRAGWRRPGDPRHDRLRPRRARHLLRGESVRIGVRQGQAFRPTPELCTSTDGPVGQFPQQIWTGSVIF